MNIVERREFMHIHGLTLQELWAADEVTEEEFRERIQMAPPVRPRNPSRPESGSEAGI